MVNIQEFVEKIKKYKEINNLNYSETATALGVSTATIILWERGVFKPRMDKYHAVLSKLEAADAPKA